MYELALIGVGVAGTILAPWAWKRYAAPKLSALMAKLNFLK
jgi:hypothetical protein